MARAACSVSATNRWAITGTPIQNRVSDFSSLLEFLKLRPFSTAKVFDDEIAKPWLKSADRDSTRMKKLISYISLCRTKRILDLPKREDLVVKLTFSPEEQEQYDRAKERTFRKFDDALSSNPLKSGQYLNALQWLNELRLLCNHGLVPRGDATKTYAINLQDTQTWTKPTANKAFEAIVCANEAVCSLCGNVLSGGAGEALDSESSKPHLSKCLTLTCGSCIKDSPSGQPLQTCLHRPLCKSVEVTWSPGVAPAAAKERVLPAIPEEHIPTKLRALLNALLTCPEGEKRYDSVLWVALE
jgi:SWI/SNF-related matrix-associated actin-dependent regulator of chromatin subfamily A3